MSGNERESIRESEWKTATAVFGGTGGGIWSERDYKSRGGIRNVKGAGIQRTVDWHEKKEISGDFKASGSLSRPCGKPPEVIDHKIQAVFIQISSSIFPWKKQLFPGKIRGKVLGVFFVNEIWYARLDLNQRPSESESDTLSNWATGAYPPKKI